MAWWMTTPVSNDAHTFSGQVLQAETSRGHQEGAYLTTAGGRRSDKLAARQQPWRRAILRLIQIVRASGGESEVQARFTVHVGARKRKQ